MNHYALRPPSSSPGNVIEDRCGSPFQRRFRGPKWQPQGLCTIDLCKPAPPHPSPVTLSECLFFFGKYTLLLDRWKNSSSNFWNPQGYLFISVSDKCVHLRLVSPPCFCKLIFHQPLFLLLHSCHALIGLGFGLERSLDSSGE
jgi:hypothetical protein